MICFYLHLALILMGILFDRGLRPQPGSTSQQQEPKTFHLRLNVNKEDLIHCPTVGPWKVFLECINIPKLPKKMNVLI